MRNEAHVYFGMLQLLAHFRISDIRSPRNRDEIVVFEPIVEVMMIISRSLDNYQFKLQSALRTAETMKVQRWLPIYIQGS